MKNNPLNALVGETISRLLISKDEITFVCESGNCYRAYHAQEWCESVAIHDVEGDLFALLGVPITKAIQTSSRLRHPVNGSADDADSFTWTNQWIETETARVRIAWLGFSNGCCSEEVHFGRTRTPAMSIG